MLTEQDIADALESKRKSEIIGRIVKTLPEDQWMEAINKEMPNESLLFINSRITFHLGGDIIIDGKRTLNR